MGRRRTGRGESLRRAWISPDVLVYLYLVYALIAFLFPARTYENLMNEPYFAGGNIRMLLFAIGCVVCLKIGMTFVKVKVPDSNQLDSASTSMEEARRKSLILVAVGVIAVNVASAFILFQQNREQIVSALILGQQTGQQLKDELVAEGAMLATNPLLILAAWTLYSLRLAGDKSRVVLGLMASSVLLSIIISTIKLARFELLPLIIGMATIKLLSQSWSDRRAGKRLRSVLAYGGIGLCAFVIFAAIRGQSSGANTLRETFVGYSVASFNRLAALLDGQLVSTYGGTGAFVLNFLSNVPVIGSLSTSFMPSSITVYMQEFYDVGASGLDRGYIWLTMYGYYYADLGLLVYPFCVGLGVVFKLAWKNFLVAGVFGTTVYPYLASAMILSFAFYWISRPFIIAIVMFLVLYFACFTVTEWLSGASGQPRATRSATRITGIKH